MLWPATVETTASRDIVSASREKARDAAIGIWTV